MSQQSGESAGTSPAFTVTHRTDYRTPPTVLLTTDDGLEALTFEHLYRRWKRLGNRRYYEVRVTGIDPSHTVHGGSCGACGAPDNGCFSIRMPCGWRSTSAFAAETDRWEAEHPERVMEWKAEHGGR